MARRKLPVTVLVATLSILALEGQGNRCEQVAADNDDAVFVVRAKATLFSGDTEEEQGTGFFISETGTALTANHVVFEDASIYKSVEVWAELPGGRVPAFVVDRDSTDDIAMLDVQVPGKVRRVSMTSATKMGKGAGVDVLAFTIGFAGSFIVPGQISSKQQPNVWTISTLVNPGNSGAPVFRDSDGKAIGLITGGARKVMLPDGTNYSLEGINFFVPLSVYPLPTGTGFFPMGILFPDVTQWSEGIGTLPKRPKPNSFTRGDYVDFTNPADTDPKTAKAHVARFQAQPGYQISEVVGTSITAQRQASQPRITLSDDKRSVAISVTLTGAGRFAATLMTRQSSAGQ